MKLKLKILAVIGMLVTASTVNANSLYVDHYKIDQLQASGWVIPATTEMHILDLQRAIEEDLCLHAHGPTLQVRFE